MTIIAVMTRIAQCKNSKNGNKIQKLTLYTANFVRYTENIKESIIQ